MLVNAFCNLKAECTNVDITNKLTEPTLSKGNEFNIEMSLTNLCSLEFLSCNVYSLMTSTHALHNCSMCLELYAICADAYQTNYLVHTNLRFHCK